jgi:hypothetical protein
LKFILILSLVFALALIPTVGALTGDESARADDDPGIEEYEVYSALVEEVLVTEASASGPVPIRDRTGCPKFVVEMESCGINAFRPETWEDFKAKNSQEFPLEERFNLSVDYDLVNERDDPGAREIVGLSRVGFDPERGQALVHIDEIAGWYISSGSFVLLVKENGRWRVDETRMTYLGE